MLPLRVQLLLTVSKSNVASSSCSWLSHQQLTVIHFLVVEQARRDCTLSLCWTAIMASYKLFSVGPTVYWICLRLVYCPIKLEWRREFLKVRQDLVNKTIKSSLCHNLRIYENNCFELEVLYSSCQRGAIETTVGPTYLANGNGVFWIT